MNAADIDFLQPAGRPRLAGRVALAVAVLALAGAGFACWTLHEDTAALQAQVAQAEQRVQRRGGLEAAVQPVSAAEAEEFRRARQVLERLDAPWDTLFAELETAARPGVVLTALQREADGRRLRLQGEAADFDDLWAYIGRLQSGRVLRHAVLLAHEVRDQRRIGFTLGAEWEAGR